MAQEQTPSLTELTAELASAYLANNRVETAQLPDLIGSIHAALSGLGQAPAEAAPEKPARPIGVRASIKPEGLISMIDGRMYKTLRRHLAHHGLSPQQYRERYDLPADYPMVSSAYSETRRALAKAIGLGRKAAGRAVETVTDTAKAVEQKVEEAVAPKRGRKPKAISGTEALAKARGRKPKEAATG